jgi:predicted GNAT family acetyltransferase
MIRIDAPITVRHRAARDAGEFVADSDRNQVGNLLYSRAHDRTILIECIFVVPEARGRCVARRLVDAAAALARRDRARVIPLCRYASVVLRQNSNRNCVRTV